MGRVPVRLIRGSDRRIWSLALPALGALLVEPLYNLTDTAVVGRLGRTPLGGLAVATAVLNVVIYGCGFLSMATAPRIAFLRGRGEADRAAAVASSAYAIAVALGVALGLFVAAAAGPLATAAGAHGAIHQQAVTYLRLASIGLPFVLCVLAGNGHLRGLADTRTAFIVTLGSNVINVVAEVVLVSVFHTGLAGSAIGTVIAQVIGAAAFVTLSRSRARIGRVADRGELRRLVAAAAVLLVRTLALLAALSGSTAVAARVSTAVLGGHQIALQVWFLVALSVDALAVPAQILVGEALGAAGRQAAAAVATTVVQVGALVGVVLGTVMVATAAWVPALFTADHAVRHAATEALLIGGVMMPLAAVAFELDGVLLGAGDLKFLRRAMVLALIGFTPLAAATLADHRLGILGIWAALACWLATRAAVLGRRWRLGTWLDGAEIGEPPLVDKG